jgi:VIT1/CCC1 family predicted Fe2+/Mn2+ transporter
MCNMSEDDWRADEALDPMNRLSEMMFGLIVAMTFIAAFGPTDAGSDDVHVMLFAAAGATFAWSLIDAVMFLLQVMGERGKDRRLLRKLRRTRSDESALQVLADALPDSLVDALPDATLAEVAAKMRLSTELPLQKGLTREDLKQATEVFILEFAAMVPVVLPFLIFGTTRVALAVSLSIAVTMLAAVGYAYGRVSGYHPLVTSAVMVLLGVCMAGLALVLGG